jgi:hypothetical protein
MQPLDCIDGAGQLSACRVDPKQVVFNPALVLFSLQPGKVHRSHTVLEAELPQARGAASDS